MSPRKANDFYPTPVEVCRVGIDLIRENLYPMLILDPGAGTGVWGQVARQRWPQAHIQGVEIREAPCPDGYSAWNDQMDYLDMDLGKFELIIGNPPFSLCEEFVHKAYGDLVPYGYLVFLLRLAFLEGQKRYRTIFTSIRPKHIAVLPKRPSFTEDGDTDMAAYALFLWQKDYIGPTTVDWRWWDYERN